ncbi:MAG: hypothetical protein HDQ88_10220 [Clostridia bacterium]|nr:hypothetical protein [Clostridia bacterium]
MGRKKLRKAQEVIAASAVVAKSRISHLKEDITKLTEEKGELIQDHLLKKFNFNEEERHDVEACIEGVTVDYQMICNAARVTIDLIVLEGLFQSEAEERINAVLHNIETMYTHLVLDDRRFYFVLLKNNLRECGTFGDDIVSFIDTMNEGVDR